MRLFLSLLMVLLLAIPALAQLLTAPSPQPENPAVYIRAEVSALGAIRDAVWESEKLEVLAKQFGAVHETVEFYKVANDVSDEYDSAISILKPYAEGKNEAISESAKNLTLAVETTKSTNAQLVTLLEGLQKAKTAEEIDPTKTAKTIADISSIQKDARMMVTLAVKSSTFAILDGQGEDNHWVPTAFTISDRDRELALSEAERLAKGRRKTETYIDLCANYLVKTLSATLPTADDQVRLRR